MDGYSLCIDSYSLCLYIFIEKLRLRNLPIKKQYSTKNGCFFPSFIQAIF